MGNLWDILTAQPKSDAGMHTMIREIVDYVERLEERINKLENKE